MGLLTPQLAAPDEQRRVFEHASRGPDGKFVVSGAVDAYDALR
jgi:hypothetical protein